MDCWLEFQKLRLEMTPQSGGSMRETERERLLGSGAWGWPWRDCVDVRGVGSSLRSYGNCLLQTPPGAEWSRAPPGRWPSVQELTGTGLVSHEVLP